MSDENISLHHVELVDVYYLVCAVNLEIRVLACRAQVLYHFADSVSEFCKFALEP